MPGLAVKLPLSRSSIDGNTLIKNNIERTKQNFKMLLLTIPGERIMDPRFGVGLKKYIFSMNTASTSELIRLVGWGSINKFLFFLK